LLANYSMSLYRLTKSKSSFQFWHHDLHCILSGSGSVSVEELCKFYNIHRTKFVDRVFGYFDFDESNELDFQEFVVGIWNFCTFSNKRMVQFCISIFEEDESGLINCYQCDALCRMLYDVTFNSEKVRNDIAKMGTESVNLETFNTLTLENPSILKPGFEFQSILQKKIIGTTFWESHSKKRSEMHGELTSAETILISKPRANPVGKKGTHNNKIIPDSPVMSGVLIIENDDDALFEFHGQIPITPMQLQVQEMERRVKELSDAFTVSMEPYLKEQQNNFAAGIPISEHLVQNAAVSKQKLQSAVNDFKALGLKALVEAEESYYKNALTEVQKLADDFFQESQGKEYLKIVGKEHALRDPRNSNAFGILNKSQLKRGEKKARNEYITRKSKESTKLVHEKFMKLNQQHIENTSDIFASFHLLRQEEETVLPIWQWQKLVDPSSEKYYYYCPAIKATVWHPPKMENYSGICEDPVCGGTAEIRCAQCDLEFCSECDEIVHSCGSAKMHTRRVPVPPEEIQWRKGVTPHMELHKQALAENLCTDVIELKRRNLMHFEDQIS